MKIIEKNIDDFKAYEKNAKKHPKDQIEKIALSIKEFGFQPQPSCWGLARRTKMFLYSSTTAPN